MKSVSDLLQDLSDHYPDPAGSEISGGKHERALARATIAALLQFLQRTNSDVAAERFAEAAGEYLNYRKLALAAAPLALQAAEPWSLFNPTLHDAHRAALRQVNVVQAASR